MKPVLFSKEVDYDSKTCELFHFKFGLRKFIAFLGAVVWLRMLALMSGFEAFNLGRRILPIVKTLSEIWTFLFIVFFFFGASYTVSYSMTNQLMTEIWLGTYKMSF